MVALYRTFDSKPTMTWIILQVILLLLIAIGIILLFTQRYWVPRIVTFILSFDEPPQTQIINSHILLHGTTTHVQAATTTVKLLTKKNDMQPASTADITLNPFSINVPSRTVLGQPLHISWKLQNLPEHGSIGFFLFTPSLIIDRPLTIETIPITDTSGAFIWDGTHYACDPLDTPAYCDGLEVGNYTISAKVFDKTEVSLVDGDRIVPLVHDEKVLYSATSSLLIAQ